MTVEHGPVGMAIGVAVGMFADIHDVSLAPARMALRADSYHDCRPMYNSFVTLRMADFCDPGKPACVCLFCSVVAVVTLQYFLRTDDLETLLESLTLSLSP